MKKGMLLYVGKRQTSPRIKRPPSQSELLLTEMAVFYL